MPPSRAGVSAELRGSVRRHPGVYAAAGAGWDEVLPSVPFLSTEWLRALGPVSGGGAGGPATEYVQVVEDGGRVRLQCLYQRLPVREMRLGHRVSAGIAAHVLGAEAHQLGQALFSGPALATDLPPERLAETIETLPATLGSGGTWFLKDCPALSAAPWVPIEAMPEMVLAIAPRWRCFEDYIAALPSKYRSRVRRARKKLRGVERRALSAADAAGFGESLQGLYDDLMARTAYAPFTVADGYVARLKALRPDDVSLLGYFDGGRLVGFATLLRDGTQGLAHLAAVDPRYNASHQLYLNVLFDLLAEAIEYGCTRLNYGRTATTIKSSVGAEPVYYDSAVRHFGHVRQRLLGRLVPMVYGGGDEGALIQRPLG